MGRICSTNKADKTCTISLCLKTWKW